MSVQVISAGEGLNTKGDVDKAALLLAQQQQKQQVTFRNRFGREVIVTLYHAKKMVRRGEGEIISEAEPLVKKSGKRKQETIEDLRAKFEKVNGRPVPSNKKNDADWIKSNLGE